MKDILFILIQYLVPHHALSRLVGYFAASEVPWIKNNLIQWFIGRYQVDMTEAAESEPRLYRSFNDFFTRALQDDARPIAADAHSIVCPADGCINEIGEIEFGRLLQAKGQYFALRDLLGGDPQDEALFADGSFATVYLSPRDYHRVHMPLSGELQRMIYIPGRLFSVNQTTANNVPNLFARNERLVCIFNTGAGPMAVILVGAMIVAGIETVWSGQVTPLPRSIQRHDYQAGSGNISLQAGEEMGRFKLGSTAIVLFGKDTCRWEERLRAGVPVQMGEQLGVLRH